MRFVRFFLLFVAAVSFADSFIAWAGQLEQDSYVYSVVCLLALAGYFLIAHLDELLGWAGDRFVGYAEDEYTESMAEYRRSVWERRDREARPVSRALFVASAVVGVVTGFVVWLGSRTDAPPCVPGLRVVKDTTP